MSNTSDKITINNMEASRTYFHFRIYNSEETRFNDIGLMMCKIDFNNSEQLIKQFSKYS